MDTTVACHYGHYGGVTLWTPRWRDIVDTTHKQRANVLGHIGCINRRQRKEKRQRPQRANVLGQIGCIRRQRKEKNGLNNRRQRNDDTHDELTFEYT